MLVNMSRTFTRRNLKNKLIPIVKEHVRRSKKKTGHQTEYKIKKKDIWQKPWILHSWKNICWDIIFYKTNMPSKKKKKIQKRH